MYLAIMNYLIYKHIIVELQECENRSENKSSKTE